MTRMWAIVGLMWVLAFLAGHSTAVSQSDQERLDSQFAEPHIDLFGNQVSEAVGDYRVDRLGDLYERHAPDTAVLKLGPPGV